MSSEYFGVFNKEAGMEVQFHVLFITFKSKVNMF